MEPVRDVIVVGGGPAGSTAAFLLAELGHDVLLLDAARFPRDKVCGESVSPGAWRVLDSLGAAASLRHAGAREVAGMRLVAPNGVSFEGVYRDGRVCGFALERRLLDAQLLDRARGLRVEVRENARVAGLLRDGPAVTGVRVADASGGDQPLRARLVVAADGRRSRIARELGLLREARWPRRFAVRGYWNGVEGLSSFGEMHVGGGGYCGVAPLATTRANVTFVLDQRAMTPAGGDLESFYRDRLRRWPRLAERLARAQLEEPPTAIGPLALESSGAWAPGVLLVGDAAGFFDPFTGEGISAALRGAEQAAEVGHGFLRERMTLAEYGRRHRRLVGQKFRFNRVVQRLIARDGLANVAAYVISRLPAAANALVDVAGDCLSDLGPARNALSCRMASPELRPRIRP